MKLKTIALLVVLAVFLGGWAWQAARKQFAPPPSAMGLRVLPAFPINEVGRISILSAGSNIVLAKTQGVWTVATRFNYPAKFSKVVECLRELDDLTVGQTLMVTESQLNQFNLLLPTTNATPAPTDKTGTLIELFDKQHQRLASLVIGKSFISKASGPMPGMDGYPNGRYVRTGEDTVFLVSHNLSRLMEDGKYWLDDEFINLPPQDILELSVTAPDRLPITLRREQAPDETFILENINKEEGAADPGKISQLTGALNYFGFDNVAPPTLTARETGLDHPIVITARTRENQIYTLRLGNTLTNDTFDRYAQVSVTQAMPPATTQAASTNAMGTAADADAVQKEQDAEAGALAEKTKALNNKLSSWIYVVKSYRAEPFLVKREDLVTKSASDAPDAGSAASLNPGAPGE